MLGLNPVSPVEAKKMGSFDFPVGITTKYCKPNVDPGGVHPHVEHWYGKLGSPPADQGWPCIMEKSPEAEDPDVTPWIDTVLDYDKPGLVYHTGRLSGDMVKELADNTHTSRITVSAVPYKGGNVVQLYSAEPTLEPQPEADNAWHWRDSGKPNELVYTVKADFDPTDPSKPLKEGEVYKLLIEWDFFHTIPGTGEKHAEPFAGFDDNITFKVGPKTTI